VIASVSRTSPTQPAFGRRGARKPHLAWTSAARNALVGLTPNRCAMPTRSSCQERWRRMLVPREPIELGRPSLLGARKATAALGHCFSFGPVMLTGALSHPNGFGTGVPMHDSRARARAEVAGHVRTRCGRRSGRSRPPPTSRHGHPTSKVGSLTASSPSPIVEDALYFEDLPVGSVASRRVVVRWSDGTEGEGLRWYG
jgi:hypothetical protein